MSIYISRNAQTTGPFEEAVILNRLKSGELNQRDLACRQGASGWQPLNAMFADSPEMAALAGDLQNAQVQPSGNLGTMDAWARHNLQQPVEVKIKYNSIPVKILFAALILAIPGLLFLASLIPLLQGNFSGFFSIIFFAVIALVFFGGLLLIVWLVRQKLAVRLDAEGVETIAGKRFLWQDLQQVKYRVHRGGSQFGLIGMLISALMSAGKEKYDTHLKFSNGKALISALSYNNTELVDLMRTAPVEQK